MKNNNSKKKISIITICLLLTVVVSIGGTLAYIVTSTLPVENIFTSSKVGNYIVEDNGGTTKKDVKVQNSISGTVDSQIVDAYIRAAYVVTWQKIGDGITYVKPAVEGDYQIDLNLDNSSSYEVDGTWVKNGDYYYFTEAIEPGGYTDILIKSIAPVEGKAPKDYSLNVEIISQSIQATPADAVAAAWKVSIANGSVTAITNQ